VAPAAPPGALAALEPPAPDESCAERSSFCGSSRSTITLRTGAPLSEFSANRGPTSSSNAAGRRDESTYRCEPRSGLICVARAAPIGCEFALRIGFVVGVD
jgi:hypothetical protein